MKNKRYQRAPSAKSTKIQYASEKFCSQRRDADYSGKVSRSSRGPDIPGYSSRLGVVASSKKEVVKKSTPVGSVIVVKWFVCGSRHSCRYRRLLVALVVLTDRYVQKLFFRVPLSKLEGALPRAACRVAGACF